MFVVQCKHGCGRYLVANGMKPTLRSCGVPYCAYKEWVQLAEKHGLADFHDW